MRTIITDDIIKKIRTTTKMMFTSKGLVQTIQNELLPEEEPPIADNTDAITSSSLIDYLDFNFINYDYQLSNSVGKGMYIYDCMVADYTDGHKIYKYNDSVLTDFELSFECDNNNLSNGHFYTYQNIDDVKLCSIDIFVIDPYTEGTEVKLVIDNEVFFKNVLEVDERGYAKVTLSTESGVQIDDEIGTIRKWEFFMVGNSNVNARSRIILNFITCPLNPTPTPMERTEEEVNDGGQ